MLPSSGLLGFQWLRGLSEKGLSQFRSVNYHKITIKLWFTAKKNLNPTNWILLARSTHRTGNIVAFGRCPTSQFTGTRWYLNSICGGDTANTDKKVPKNTAETRRGAVTLLRRNYALHNSQSHFNFTPQSTSFIQSIYIEGGQGRPLGEVTSELKPARQAATADQAGNFSWGAAGHRQGRADGRAEVSLQLLLGVELYPSKRSAGPSPKHWWLWPFRKSKAFADDRVKMRLFEAALYPAWLARKSGHTHTWRMPREDKEMGE